MLTTMPALGSLSVPGDNRREPNWKEITQTIADPLERMERQFRDTFSSYPKPISTLVENLQQYRGKRLRPALVFFVAQACGGTTPAHVTLATVIEMIHTATLVHDDVLDEATMRRHTPTIHHTHGNKASILLGDLLFTNAFHLASSVDQRACQIIGEATNRVCAGEIRQTCQRGDLQLSECEYFAIIAGKTAALIECATRAGAIYAGAKEAKIEQMAQYGHNVGLAFQISDDLLDLIGEEEQTGKTMGTDLEERKLTLPVIHCLARLPAAEAKQLRDEIEQHGASSRKHVLIKMEQTGSIMYAKKKAEECVLTALDCLSGLPRSRDRIILERIAQWSLQRPA